MSNLVDITEQLQTIGATREPQAATWGTQSTAWEAQAACRTVDNALDLFFSDEVADIAASKRVCASCPVMAACLETALDRQEQWGVWGGQLFINGEMLATKRRRGRPPKVARPEDLMPVVPIPIHLQERAQRLSA